MREEYISVKDRKRAAEIFAAELRADGLTPEPAVPHGKAIASSFWGRAWCLEGLREPSSGGTQSVEKRRRH